VSSMMLGSGAALLCAVLGYTAFSFFAEGDSSDTRVVKNHVAKEMLEAKEHLEKAEEYLDSLADEIVQSLNKDNLNMVVLNQGGERRKTALLSALRSAVTHLDQ